MATPASMTPTTDKAWPPAAVVRLAGAIDVEGQLEHDAELRVQADGKRAVVAIELSTGMGFRFAAALFVVGDPHVLQDAQALARSLRRGITVRVRARGCHPRTDHGTAVLQLLEVESVAPTQEEA